MVNKGVVLFERAAFGDSSKKYTGESAVISMRLPRDMLQEIDTIAADTGRTRNEVLTLCMEFALNHLDRGSK